MLRALIISHAIHEQVDYFSAKVPWDEAELGHAWTNNGSVASQETPRHSRFASKADLSKNDVQ